MVSLEMAIATNIRIAKCNNALGNAINLGSKWLIKNPKP
jgi:hypothetical protein